jgi:hypothetical protein
MFKSALIFANYVTQHGFGLQRRRGMLRYWYGRVRFAAPPGSMAGRLTGGFCSPSVVTNLWRRGVRPMMTIIVVLNVQLVVVFVAATLFLFNRKK